MAMKKKKIQMQERLQTIPFLFFPGGTLEGSLCGSTHKVMMPFFAKDNASASWISDDVEYFFFPSAYYPIWNVVSDAGVISPLQFSRRYCFNVNTFSHKGTPFTE